MKMIQDTESVNHSTVERARTIAAYVAPGYQELNMFARVAISGTPDTHPVYRVPISLLHFNIKNGRFAAELLSKEAELGHSLDPLDAHDARIVRALLLEQSEVETLALRRDLERHGQWEPGLITPDGAVINANRRMAILSTLYEETGEDRYAFLKVAVLPAHVDLRDLWRIEAGLQFSKDFKQAYGPINELLKLREARDLGMNAREISAALNDRYSDPQIEQSLKTLELIENFLEDIGKPKNYEHITKNRLMEKFRSLNDVVLQPAKRREDRPIGEVQLLTEVAFGLIDKTKHSHWDIRKLSNIVRHQKAFKALKESLPDPLNPMNASELELDEAFKSATEIVDNEKYKDRPRALLIQAINAVGTIDRTNPAVFTSQIQNLVEELLSSANQLKRLSETSTR